MNSLIFRARGAFSRPLGRVLTVGLSLALLAGCMSLDVERTSYVPIASAENAKEIQLAQPLSAMLTNESSVSLPAGSRWVQTGAVPQGDVYRRIGSVFMTDARRVRETYLVISDGALKGFYFPGETLFTPAPNATHLVLEKK
jgi:hypothetical protein